MCCWENLKSIFEIAKDVEHSRDYWQANFLGFSLLWRVFEGNFKISFWNFQLMEILVIKNFFVYILRNLFTFSKIICLHFKTFDYILYHHNGKNLKIWHKNLNFLNFLRIFNDKISLFTFYAIKDKNVSINLFSQHKVIPLNWIQFSMLLLNKILNLEFPASHHWQPTR